MTPSNNLSLNMKISFDKEKLKFLKWNTTRTCIFKSKTKTGSWSKIFMPKKLNLIYWKIMISN